VSTDPRLLDDDATEIGVTGPGAGQTVPSKVSSVPEAGERVAHFVVEQVLGIGGMGVVLRAHDQRLDRSVALKLVRPEFGGSQGTRGTERLLIEARAMAKISDPNVITVHEVGVVDNQVFLAMEFIDGQTLGDWVEAEPRSWVELVRTWIAAGRGLAAAHAAGLVHRDFKPANVLVCRDGRILVTDFGIAGASGGQTGLDAELSSQPVAGTESQAVLGPEDLSRQVSRLTETGGLLGTPRYMAPEQFHGQRVDARADQFAFCVALWEAVYGRHPFDSSNLAALALAASTGALREPPRGHGAPERLRRILTRGLATAPEDRFADVSSLLAALEGLVRRRARRRWLIPIAVAVPAVAAAAWALWPKPPDPCALDEQRWAGIWDDEVRTEIAAAMAAADRPFIREGWPRVETRVDAYVEAWDEHQQRACADTRVRGTVSDQMLDRRMSCLDTRRRHLSALVAGLREGQSALLAQAIEAIAQLPALDECDDFAMLEAEVPLPPAEIRDELARFDEDLAEVQTLSLAGDNQAAIEILDGWGPRLAELGDAHSEAQRLRNLAGRWIDRDNVKACDYYRQAYAESVAAGAVWLGTLAALKLAGCVDEGGADRSEFWLDVAASGYAQLDRPLDFVYYMDVGAVRHERRDFEGTIEALETALTVADEDTEERHLLVAEGNLGGMYAQTRRFDEAAAHIGRAVERGTVFYGPLHPQVLNWRANLIALRMMGGDDMDTILREAQEVLEAQEAGLGPREGAVAVTLTVMGVAARGLDRVDEASEYDARAYEIRKAAFGPSHWLTVESLEKLARDHILAGEPEQGVAELREVVELLGQNHGPEHAEVGRAWTTLGWGLAKAGQVEEAIAAQRKAVELIVAANPDYPRLFDSYAQLGATLLDAGEHAEAAAALARAHELGAARSLAPRDSIQILFQWAEARRAQRAGDPRAVELAREALDMLEAEDPDNSLREDIEAFLAEG